MNSLTRIMSYDKTKIKNQENCNCMKCVSVENAELKNQTIEYPKLSEEEIEKIIFERYSDKDEKTKTFIRKALRVHGDCYDYSNVIYVKAKSEVEIICRVEGHKPFLQTPDKHLSGHGCSICGVKKRANEQRLLLAEFIEKSNKKHGIGTYDYSESKYINYITKVKIICPKEGHGEFWQTPSNHLKGKGCPMCACNRKLTTEEFIRRAKEVHDEITYDYSKTKYINAKTKVIIICPKHGEFEQTPRDHLRGYGCLICGGNQKLTTEEFIEKAKSIHDKESYDYSKIEYVNNHTKVIIICPKHGEFEQTPSNHLKGEGCPICGLKYRAEIHTLTTKEFIEKANKVQGIGVYDYSKVEYINAKTKITIICPKHGEFLQTPAKHLQSDGCPKCNKNKGEEVVRKFLILHNIEFEEQKTFKNCKYKQPLKFDFYLPKYNLCVESDGSPHYRKVNWNGKMTDEEMEENLKLNQHRDNIKNDYCKKNGIVLLRFNAFEILKKLTEYFQNHAIIAPFNL